MKRRLEASGRFAIACLLASGCVALAQSTSNGEKWLASWSTALVIQPPPGSAAVTAQAQPSQAPQAPTPPPINLNNQTLREIVHVSAGGARVRVVLANTFGTAPLTIGAAHIALRDQGAKIKSVSGRALTFGGRASVTIPAGAVMLSDAAAVTVPALSDVAIDLFLPEDLTKSASPLTIHSGANQTNYLSAPGNHTGAPELPVSGMLRSWIFLASVEVAAPQPVGAIVAFGDSITDGTRSTADANARWPDQLARRLAASKGNVRAVLNTGIAANRVLGEINAPVFPFGFSAGVNALARFDRDVIAQTGAADLIVLEGINDLGLAGHNPLPSSEDLIAAHQQMIERAHAHNLKIFGATLLPFEGAAYWTQEGEAKRQAFNAWLKKGTSYDALVDFDAVVRDPANPTKMLPRYDSGDHLHPNDAGYAAMGNAIDLQLFETAPGAKKLKAAR